MSIFDLKQRLADVPGIETLTMGLESGRIMLRWDGYSASVDAAASDQDIETAIRNAIKLPPVSLIPDKPAPVISPAPANGVAPMSTAPGAAGLTIKEMMEDHTRLMGEIHQAQIQILQSSLARQRDTVATAVGTVAQKIDAQTDEFMSIMGQFTNLPGIE